MELFVEIMEIFIQEFTHNGNLYLKWDHIIGLFVLLFAWSGLRHGWQRHLVMLVSFFFCWAIALRTTDFLIHAMDVVLGLDYSGEMEGLFSILLYFASVGFVYWMTKPITQKSPYKASGFLSGALSGYFFTVFLLDLGRKWLEEQIWVSESEPTLSLHLPADLPDLSTYLINNPSETYMQLTAWQNMLSLLVLMIFLYPFVSTVLGYLDRR